MLLQRWLLLSAIGAVMLIQFLYLAWSTFRYDSSDTQALSPLGNPKYAAVTVLRTMSPIVIPTIQNFLANLPFDWLIQLYCCTPQIRQELETSHLQPFINSHRVLLTDYSCPPPSDGQERTLQEVTFWQRCIGEKVLYFTTGSVLCSRSPFNVSHFLKWDFVGLAQTTKLPVGVLPPIGTGGAFSIRSRDHALKVLKKFSPNNDPEDVYFTRYLPMVGASVAPGSVSVQFVLSEYPARHAFGVYVPWVNSPQFQTTSENVVRDIEVYCPEYRMVGLYNRAPGASQPGTTGIPKSKLATIPAAGDVKNIQPPVRPLIPGSPAPQAPNPLAPQPTSKSPTAMPHKASFPICDIPADTSTPTPGKGLVLVTGVRSAIGAAIAHSATKMGHGVVAVDQLAPWCELKFDLPTNTKATGANVSSNVQLLSGDIADALFLDTLLSTTFTHIYHVVPEGHGAARRLSVLFQSMMSSKKPMPLTIVAENHTYADTSGAHADYHAALFMVIRQLKIAQPPLIMNIVLLPTLESPQAAISGMAIVEAVDSDKLSAGAVLWADNLQAPTLQIELPMGCVLRPVKQQGPIPHSAALIETEFSHHFAPLVINYINNLPSSWPIQLFLPRPIQRLVRTSRLRKWVNSARLVLADLPEEFVDMRDTLWDTLLTTTNFWEQCLGDQVLLLSLDGLFCSNYAKPMDKFLKYDMIGPYVPGTSPPMYFGEFSLRTRSSMLEVLHRVPYNGGPEHEYFVSALRQLKAHLPPKEVAHEFVFHTPPMVNAFAVLRPWHPGNDLERIKGQVETWCPEYRIVRRYENKAIRKTFFSGYHSYLDVGEWDSEAKRHTAHSCAQEGGTCQCNGRVRFGKTARFIEREVKGSIACTAEAFGGDPAFGTLKECRCIPNPSQFERSTRPAILVTSAQSRLGTLITTALLQLGYFVVAMDSWTITQPKYYATEMWSNADLFLVNGDVSDAAFVAHVFQLVGPFVAIFHLMPSNVESQAVTNLLYNALVYRSPATFVIIALAPTQPVAVTAMKAQLQNVEGTKPVQCVLVEVDTAVATPPTKLRPLTRFITGLVTSPPNTQETATYHYIDAQHPLLSPYSPSRLPLPITGPERDAECLRQHVASLNKTAMILETRFPESFVATIQYFHAHLSHDWIIQVIGSAMTLDKTKQSRLKELVASGRVVLTLLPKLDGINWVPGAVSQVFATAEFWEKTCLGEKILLFQMDSILCANSRHHVDDFVQFDYVGAAWSHYPPYTGKDFLPMTGGNGGLSIRSKSKLIQTIRQFKWDGMPEDVYFCKYINALGGLVAGWGYADKFSVEGRWVIGSLGVHQPWVTGPGLKHNSEGFIQEVEDYCPEYRMSGRYGRSQIGGPTSKPSFGHQGPNPAPCRLPEDSEG